MAIGFTIKNLTNLDLSQDPSTEAGLMTTVRCEDSLEQETENALVQKDSSVKKRPVKVEASLQLESLLGSHLRQP